jgi:LPXTG-motif cell wall-anchored protein
MIAHLVDKETGKDIAGTETKITLKVGEPSGKVDVAIDVSKLKGKTVVVFEECRLDGVLVAEHKDVKDRHQTVTAPKEHEPTPKTPTPSGSHPQTGDNSKPLLALGLIMASAMSIAMALKRRPGDGE